MIGAIFFDAHGVLYTRQETTTPYARRLLAGRGYPMEVSATAREQLMMLRERALIGKVDPAGYWDVFLQAHGVEDLLERGALVAQIMEHPHRVSAMPGAEMTLRELKRRRFGLGVITDTMYSLEWKLSWLARVGVAEVLDVVACSTVVGARKPDPAIYHDALARAGATGRQSAFVGHEESELEGARRVGMKTVAVNYAPGVAADFHVETLPDLLNLPIFLEDPGDPHRQIKFHS